MAMITYIKTPLLASIKTLSRLMLSDVLLGVQHVSESERAGRGAPEHEPARSRLRGRTLLVPASEGS